jgi:hypothetical protein
MPVPAAQPPSDRIAGRQIAIWSAFTVLLVIGLVLYFLYANNFPPLLDVLTDR